MHGTLPVRKTYKTAEELEITQEIFDALAWFVDQCDAGLVIDIEPKNLVALQISHITISYTKPPSLFHFSNIYNTTECGTVGCILGWISHRVPNHKWPNKILHLFYNYRSDAKAIDARNATVRVLRGEPAW